MSLTHADLSRLEELAKAATPGKRTATPCAHDPEGCDYLRFEDGTDLLKTDSGTYPPEMPDALFIAACDRETILELVAEIHGWRTAAGIERTAGPARCILVEPETHVDGSLTVESARAEVASLEDQIQALPERGHHRERRKLLARLDDLEDFLSAAEHPRQKTLVEQVIELREGGATFAEIGVALGISGQEASRTARKAAFEEWKKAHPVRRRKKSGAGSVVAVSTDTTVGSSLTPRFDKPEEP